MLEARRDNSPERIKAAQARIYKRYEGAILRYAQALLRDKNAADEIVSDFGHKLVTGRFEAFRPEQGRFRDYLKRTLHNSVKDWYKQNGKQLQSIPDAELIMDCRSPSAERLDDARFLDLWRSSLLTKAWEELVQEQNQTGKLLATVLWETFSSEARDAVRGLTSDDLMSILGKTSPAGAKKARDIAQKFAAMGIKPDTEDRVRAIRKEARDALKDFLLREVWNSIEAPSRDNLESELIELGLKKDMESAVERRFVTGRNRKPSRRSD